MRKRIVSGIMLALLLTSVTAWVFKVQPVKASGTIYIMADGSVEPLTANITSADNVTYYFIDNNFDEIVVERDNIVVDGAGCTLQGTGAWGTKGIDLTGRSNVTIKNMKIMAFYYGISQSSSSKNSIIGNNITTGGGCGVFFDNASTNVMSGNSIRNSMWAISLENSSQNIISNNNVSNSNYGISLMYSSVYNTLFENNIVDSSQYGIFLHSSSHNNICRNARGPIYLGASHNNTVSENSIVSAGKGIELGDSSYNIIRKNNLTGTTYGIASWSSSENKMYHNNFINNSHQVLNPMAYYSINMWDNGYPSGGNYWDDYTGVDVKSGPYQNETGSDGIGDTPYIIDAENQDRYPLMHPWMPLEGDVNSDRIVDIYDIIIWSDAFHSQPGYPNWNPDVDLNQDEIVDIFDAVIIAVNYGKTYP